jgi:GNAT superfamily N-acetyltransferase
MYTFNVLHDSTAITYQKLTFPSYGSLLGAVESNQSTIAIGASYLGQPVGLVLAEIIPDDSLTVELLSIFVDPSHRLAGIGTELFKVLAATLREKNCTKVKLVYTTGKLTTPILEHLLAKSNWSSPQTLRLVCKGIAQRVLEAPWMNKYSQLPSSYSLFPWTEITPEERETIEQTQQAQPWIPEDLIPFPYEQEENFEPLNSLGLRYQGQVVGWVINHRIAPDTIRYTCSFVRKDLQKMGRIITLYAEASKLQLQENIPYGLWIVPTVHEAMFNFIQHRLAPYLISVSESRGTVKFLTDEATGS